MRSVFFILAVLALSSSRSWAWLDDPAMAASVIESTRTISGGVVKSVSWADPTKETKSEIVVTDPSRKTTHVVITGTTTLWGADDKAIMPDKIRPRARVNVIYFTTPEGINIGQSVKVLK
ncbi:MAG: hypothetical protein KGK03_02570 [Candidatus Omnitrophica bacterium]|nr:hypothetical protein [Candidatus Omnitrophota bacterium]